MLQRVQAQPGAQRISPWPLATAVCALPVRRVGNPAALDFLRWAQPGGRTLDRAEDGSRAGLLLIIQRFAGLPFDLADASMAEMAARLNIRQILTIDADLDVYRGREGKPLIAVLRPA